MNKVEEYFNSIAFKAHVVIVFPKDPDLVLNWTVGFEVKDMAVDVTEGMEARFLAAIQSGGIRVQSIRLLPDETTDIAGAKVRELPQGETSPHRRRRLGWWP